MGTENSGRPNFPMRPSSTSFAPAPSTVEPFSSARPSPPARFSDPSVRSPPITFVSPSRGPYQRFPTQPFPSTSQTPPIHEPPLGQPPFQPPASQVLAPPVSFGPQTKVLPVPIISPTQPVNYPPSSGNVPQPQSDSLFLGPRANFQLAFPPPESSYSAINSDFQTPFGGYPRKQPAGSQAPSPFPAHQGSFMPPPLASSSPFSSQQRSYVPSPPPAAPSGYQLRGQMQLPGSAPPIGVTQNLAEGFSSLSLAYMPGSIEPGLDYRTLPRPLDEDVEPSSFVEMYPMNCNSRYLRLTTSAIPNSQSLASRWLLPLGAVFCPLAEAPEGMPEESGVATSVLY